MRVGLRWTSAAVLIWSALILGCAVHAWFFPWSHTVFDIYGPASRKWWTGQDIYTVCKEHYRYSPLFAIAISPFALLPEPWGGALWKVFNCLFYAFSLAVMAQRLLPLRLTRTQTSVLFLLVLPLSLHSLYIGQANLLMLGAILLGLSAAAADRWTGAAVWLAVATLIKVYPLALALLLMGLYPKRFAHRFLFALSAGLLLPLATQWPGTVVAQYESWFSHLLASTSIMRERVRGFDHLLAVYGFPLSPETFLLMEILAGGAVLALCVLHARWTSAPRQRFTRILILFALWVVLFGPATESCSYVILAPAVAWSILEAFQREASWLARTWLVLSLLLMGPLVTDMFGPLVRNFANESGSQPIGALLFLIYQLVPNQHGTQTPPVVRPERTAPLRTAA
jgi:hypothetical protein